MTQIRNFEEKIVSLDTAELARENRRIEHGDPYYDRFSEEE